MGRGLPLVACALLGAVLVGGCDDRPQAPAPARTSWTEAALPLPAGPPGRLVLRDATWCTGHWYVVGGVVATDGSSRPAVWTSADGRSWRSVPTAPVGFYARRALLSSVACRGTELAAVGAKAGGAHFMPRTSTFTVEDGVLVDVPAPYTRYGGADAVSVGPIAAGPDGWMIAGSRRSGAAVWVSPDGRDFRLVDDDPALSSTTTSETAALAPVADAAGWTVVGRVQEDGRGAPDPAAWTSADGVHWTREGVPSTTSYGDLERVVPDGAGLLAVGLRGDGFGSWTRRDGRWVTGPAFGRLAGSGGAPYVAGLARAGSGAVASVSDGAHFGLWSTRDGRRWRQVSVPVRPRVRGDEQLTVASDGETVLLVADDGKAGRVWWGRGVAGRTAAPGTATPRTNLGP